MKKIIIWLFERYAMDYWIDQQQQEEQKRFQEKYNLKDDEVTQAMIDSHQVPLREAFEAGRLYESEKTLSERTFF